MLIFDNTRLTQMSETHILSHRHTHTHTHTTSNKTTFTSQGITKRNQPVPLHPNTRQTPTQPNTNPDTHQQNTTKQPIELLYLICGHLSQSIFKRPLALAPGLWTNPGGKVHLPGTPFLRRAGMPLIQNAFVRREPLASTH